MKPASAPAAVFHPNMGRKANNTRMVKTSIKTSRVNIWSLARLT